MATLYADPRVPAPTGNLCRVLLSGAGEAQYPDPPPEAGPPLHFDHDTNPDLVARLHQSTDGWRIEDMALLDPGGEPVTINPPAPTPPAVDPDAIGAALAALPDDAPLTKADLAPLLALFGAGK